MHDLGKMVLAGLGCEKEEEHAQEWFRKAFSAFCAREPKEEKPGYLRYRIGKMYAFGYGVDQNYLKAAEWYEKSVAEGNPFVAYALGSLYHRGQGVDQDEEKAFICLPWRPQMRISRTLFFKWGIQFEEEYAVEEKGNRKVAYAEKQEILDGIVKKYHPEWLMENAPPAEAIPPAGGQAQAMTERNQPSSREKGKGGGTGLRTAPRAARPERKAEEGIQESRMLHLPKTAEVSEDGQA